MLKLPNYKGVKTGITDAAGPCLSCHYEEDYENGEHKFKIELTMVILKSKSMEARWLEIP